MTYIKPPASHECKWRSGPPPEVGWWPASVFSPTPDPEWIRYWDGKRWSVGDHMSVSRKRALIDKDVKSSSFFQTDIQWTDRWWLK